MSNAEPTIPELEAECYKLFLAEFGKYAKDETNGIKFKNMTAAAGVMAKQRQTKGAMFALSYQIERDKKKNLIPIEFKPESEF